MRASLRHFWRGLSSLLVFLPLLPVTAAGEVDFARDVQPILSNHCYACHGPDDKERAADLRLDTEEGARAALFPGDAGNSELFLRVSSTDPDEVMPPPKNKNPLSSQQIATLKRWIGEGATWGVHWAFEAPRRPVTPAVPGGGAHPIDAFIEARLAREGIEPLAEALPETLLRRVSLDLTGLPPTLEERERFLAADAETGYELAVNRLLDSPHFGERWARWWMDAARYADSNGYEKDSVRHVWPYRDWLIDSFNRNQPFDRFVIRQVGGDLLPDATVADRVATGFLRNGMVNEEGAIDYEQFRVEGIFDRMDAIGKSVLGLTTQCAQCHTHKYDPITHEEYFGMFAFLNNAREATVPYHTPEAIREIRHLEQEAETVRRRARDTMPDWEERFAAWIEEKRSEIANEPEWTVITPEPLGDGGQKFYARPDGSLITMGFAPATSSEKFVAETELEQIASLRLELLMDPYLTYGGPGRSIEGTAALSELKLLVGPSPSQLKEVKLEVARSDLDLPERPIDAVKYPRTRQAQDSGDHSGEKRVEGPARFATDGDGDTAWATEAGAGRSNQPRLLVVNLAEPLAREGDGPLHVRFDKQCRHGGWNSNDNQHRNLGRFRFALSPERYPGHRPLSPRVRDAIARDRDSWSAEEERALFDAWLADEAEFHEWAARLDELAWAHPVPTPQLVVKEIDGQRRPTTLFHRGEQHQPRHEVRPHVPAFLHDLPEGDGESRLTFARWLVDRDSPTTARTLVNLVWQEIFGIGIVESVEDLGHQALPASHPDLLDWLAVEFMESGWDFKHLVRVIVTSDAYRRDSRWTDELQERDPRNRLLARGPRFRPHAEMVRDIQLAASGLLERSVGGESVYPPIPRFLFEPPVSYGWKMWREDEEPERRYRRALYTFRFRTVPPPFLAAFDAPTGEVSCVTRPRSTTPLQALATLNEPLSIEAARALGAWMRERAGASGKTSLAIRDGFIRCTGRRPGDSELALLVDLWKSESEREGDAAWTTVGRVLLNLDETITKS